MNICTCVLYHEVLVYGVRHIRNYMAHDALGARMHLYKQIYAVCMIEICSSSLHRGFPRLLILLNLSRGGSVLLSKGLVVTEVKL